MLKRELAPQKKPFPSKFRKRHQSPICTTFRVETEVIFNFLLSEKFADCMTRKVRSLLNRRTEFSQNHTTALFLTTICDPLLQMILAKALDSSWRETK